uniref:Uncharacterized protein n=3 Tax=Meloidogyne TaxID=189290 RepID=A0A6V7XVS2_MELEN|nr:unnamed protein product [Meloidogyne enterolobii]
MFRSKQNRGNRSILSPFLLLLVFGFLFTVEKVVAMEGVDNATTGEGAVESPKKEGNGSSSDGHSVIMDVPIEGDEEEDVKNVPIEGEGEKVLSRSPSSSSSSSKSSSNGSSKKEMPEPSDVQLEEDVFDMEEPSNITEADNEYMVEAELEKESEEFGGDYGEEQPSSPKQSSPKATSPHSSPSASPRKMGDLEEQYIEEHHSSPKANYDSDEELPQPSSPKATSPHSSPKGSPGKMGEVFSFDEELAPHSPPKTVSPHLSPKNSPEKFDDSESSEDLPASYGPPSYLPSDEELMARKSKGKEIEKSPSVSSTKTEKSSDNEFEELESPQFTPPRLSSSELKKELEKNYGLVVPKGKHLDEGDDGSKSKGMRKTQSLPELSQKSEDFSPLKSEKLSASFSHDVRENKAFSPKHAVVTEKISSPLHVSHHQKMSGGDEITEVKKSEIEEKHKNDGGEKTPEKLHTPPSSPLTPHSSPLPSHPTPMKDNHQMVRKPSIKDHFNNLGRKLSETVANHPIFAPVRWIGGRINAIKNFFGKKKEDLKTKKALTMKPIEGDEHHQKDHPKDKGHKHEEQHGKEQGSPKKEHGKEHGSPKKEHGMEHGSPKKEPGSPKKGEEHHHKGEASGHPHQKEGKPEKIGH